MNWLCLLILFIVALACCAIGFKRFVWFLSIGYGFAVEGIAVAAFFYGLIIGNMTVGLAVGIVVCAVYGLRLGLFLLKREMKNKNYQKVLKDKVGKEPPVFVKAIVWLLVGVLYVAQTAGLHFRMTNGTADDACLWVGIVIMAAGAVIEAMADKQKSEQKNRNPNMVAMEGLFKFVRCPNYFGEILFWTGVLVTGITSYTGAFQWILAILGYICIVYVMVDGAKRMEKGHMSRYGQSEEYQAYAGKTPILFPLIPLYHLNKQ